MPYKIVPLQTFLDKHNLSPRKKWGTTATGTIEWFEYLGKPFLIFVTPYARSWDIFVPTCSDNSVDKTLDSLATYLELPPTTEG